MVASAAAPHGFDPPLQAQGRVLTSILKGGSRFATGQVLAINDVHGNLTDDGLSYTDPYTGTKDTAGGIATLATYLKQARATDPRDTLTVAAGDMVGASPPASGLLRDKPTLDALNKMGIDVGTLGNHEFDRGVPEMLKQVDGGQSTVDPSITFDKSVLTSTTTRDRACRAALSKIGESRRATIASSSAPQRRVASSRSPVWPR